MYGVAAVAVCHPRSCHMCVRSMIRFMAGSNASSVNTTSPFTIFAKVWLSIIIRIHCDCGMMGAHSSSLPSFAMAVPSSS